MSKKYINYFSKCFISQIKLVTYLECISNISSDVLTSMCIVDETVFYVM